MWWGWLMEEIGPCDVGRVSNLKGKGGARAPSCNAVTPIPIPGGQGGGFGRGAGPSRGVRCRGHDRARGIERAVAESLVTLSRDVTRFFQLYSLLASSFPSSFSYAIGREDRVTSRDRRRKSL